MKREDVSKIFENATEEQITELLDIRITSIIVDIATKIKPPVWAAHLCYFVTVTLSRLAM